MAKLGINTGTSPDAGDGDALLTGAIKINSNFDEVYNLLGDGTNLAPGIVTSIVAGTNVTVSGSTGQVTINASSGGGTSSQWETTDVGIHTLSNVGIGTTNPTSALTVKGNTSLETLNVSGVSTFIDDVKISEGSSLDFGSGAGDLHIYRQSGGSSDSIIKYDGSYNFKILSDITTLASSDGSVTWGVFGNNGVELYYGNSKKFETLGTGVTVTGTTFTNQLSVSGIATFTNNLNTIHQSGLNPGITLRDTSNNILLGMYYDTSSTQSYLISEQKNLNIKVYSPQYVYIRAGDEVMALFQSNGPVSLYYDNVKKFETLGTGVTVTGTTFTNDLSVSGASTFNSTLNGLYLNNAANVKGTSNIAIGQDALLNHTFGNNSIGIGFRALYNASNSNFHNIGIGPYAGYNLTNGVLNTFLGYNSGYDMDGGSGNVIIGSFNGNSYGLDISDADDYIILSANGQSSTQPRLIVDPNGNIGIGTTNATSKLTVQSTGSASDGENAAHPFAIKQGTSDRTLWMGYATNIGGIGEEGGYINAASTGFSRPIYLSSRNQSQTPFVGIGTDRPTGTSGQMLQVNGGAYVSGNLGIGSANPTVKLEVNGSVRVGIDTSSGVILTSPNGTKYQLFVEDDGTLNTVAV